MRQRQVKKLRRYLLGNLEKVLILIRNEYGTQTENMGPRQVYQTAKKMFKQGKFKLPRKVPFV